MGSDADIAGLAIIGIFIMPVLAFIVVRVLAHRERIEMIRRGMEPRGGGWNAKAWTNADMPHDTAMSARSRRSGYEDSPERSLRKGIMLALVGLAIFIGLSFVGFQMEGPIPIYRPGPWLLGGLIPMFVGIAQIIVALLSGARLGIPNAAMYPPPQPPPMYPPTGPDAPAYGPEARAHSGYEELKRPVPPPDRR